MALERKKHRNEEEAGFFNLEKSLVEALSECWLLEPRQFHCTWHRHVYLA